MRRSLVDTYLKVRYSLAKSRILKGRELSIRKSFCLQFLKWCYTAKDEDRNKFVELSKEFRKVEQKIGSTRTLLERKARRLYWKISLIKRREPGRKAVIAWCKMSQRKKIGVFSPEYQANLKEHTKRMRKIQSDTDRESRTSWWLLTSPIGEIFKIRNLTKWCKENGFSQAAMNRTAFREGATYRGWKAQKYSPDMDSLL